MTLIQCFDPSRLENMAGCLRLQPDKLILLGDAQQMDDPVVQYREVLLRRGQSMKIEPYPIDGMEVSQVVQLLKDLADREEEPVLDLTDGTVEVTMAAGALVAEGSCRGKLRLQRYESETGCYVDCDGDGRTVEGQPISLTADQMITLYGGLVHPMPSQLPEDANPRTLQPLWEVVCDNPKEWNHWIPMLAELESRAGFGMKIQLSVESLTESFPSYPEKKETLDTVREALKKAGVIKDETTDKEICYEYTHPLFRYCTKKAGNALEVKVLLEAKALKKNGKPFFDDCQMGVTIDWDGQIFSPEEHVAETRNEVDLILTRGTRTLFISCKNGNIPEIELYKLSTLAEEFGGPYVRKMLIATNLDRGNEAANKFFERRAKDMGVELVDDGAGLSRKKWAQLLEDAMR